MLDGVRAAAGLVADVAIPLSARRAAANAASQNHAIAARRDSRWRRRWWNWRRGVEAAARTAFAVPLRIGRAGASAVRIENLSLARVALLGGRGFLAEGAEFVRRRQDLVAGRADMRRRTQLLSEPQCSGQLRTDAVSTPDTIERLTID